MRALDVARMMTAEDRRAARRQFGCRFVGPLIRAGDGEALLQQQRGDRGQPGPTDADEMDVYGPAFAGGPVELFRPGREGGDGIDVT